MKRQVWLTTLIGMLAVACGDDVASADTDTDTEGTTSTSGTDPTVNPSTSSTTDVDPDSSSSGDPTDPSTSSSTGDPTDAESSSSTTDDTNSGEPVDFMITIENISDQGPLPNPFSPGVWIEQDASVAPVYTLNQPASDALQLLAEDGDPSDLATDIDGLGGVLQSGVFDTPVDGADVAPILPGESYEVMFTAQPGSRLGLASMMVGSNDVFWATGPQGIALYLGNGDPIDREITTDLNLFDAGTEANQPPAGGIYQPAGGLGLDAGPAESGVISMKNESTRHVVGARRLLDFDVELLVSKDGMEFLGYEVTIENISGDTGGFVSAMSPVAWALHQDTVSLITPGGNADDLPGLEALAEDGDATTLGTTLGGLAEVDQVGVAGAAPFGPGETVSFTFLPNPGSDVLSFGTMLVMTNDAIIALEPEGVRTLGEDEDGNIVPRNPSTIANELIERMEVWDIGTEANETPGAGANIAVNQAAPDTGADDPDTAIRYYNDPTNDLADITSDLEVLVSITDGDVDISILNLSEDTEFQFTLSPGVSAMTPAGTPLFAMGEAAGAGLESLAEDGDPATFDGELDAVTDGETQTVAAIPFDDLETITLTAPTSANPVFHYASMIVPSNDTYIATGPDGVNIFNGDALLSEEEIEDAILAALQVYDAGTEQNQAAARGRDMAPLQSGPNVGENEGNELVRIVTPGANGALSNEPVWEYPRLDQMIRVTVTPVR